MISMAVTLRARASPTLPAWFPIMQPVILYITDEMHIQGTVCTLSEGSNGCLIGYVITVTARRCGNANDVSVHAYGCFVR